MKTDKSDTIKKALLKALEKNLGVVTLSCKSVNIHRSTYYEWINNDPEFKKAVEDINNVALDFAESQLHKQIQSGSTPATIFYLKTKGKKRGYIERQEFTGLEGTKLFEVEILKNDKNEDPN